VRPGTHRARLAQVAPGRHTRQAQKTRAGSGKTGGRCRVLAADAALYEKKATCVNERNKHAMDERNLRWYRQRVPPRLKNPRRLRDVALDGLGRLVLVWGALAGGAVFLWPTQPSMTPQRTGTKSPLAGPVTSARLPESTSPATMAPGAGMKNTRTLG